MPPVRIAHVATIDFTVGRLLLDKLTMLAELGYEVEAIASPGRYYDEIVGAGIAFHAVPMKRTLSPLSAPISIARMARLFARRRYTIVHTHTAKAGLIGRVAARLARVPLVFHTSHGLPFYKGQGALQYKIYRQFERLAGGLSDALFSQNHEDLVNIRDARLIRPDRLFYEGNGVNIARWDALRTRIDREAARAALGLTPGQLALGMFARLEPVKGHDTFLEAFAPLAARHPRVVCLMAGKGYLETEILERIRAMGLSDRVRFLGFRDDMAELLTAIDVLVLPSEKEGIPRVAMEAMALGRPVVATDVLGTRELVVDGQTGLLVPWGDAPALERALEIVIADEGIRERFGAAGRRRIEDEYDERQVVARIDEVYRRLLAGKGLAAP